jgi:hypothetical protein
MSQSETEAGGQRGWFSKWWARFKPRFLNWWVMFKPLAFVVGVPVGITVGVLVGAGLELFGESHSAAWGLLSGFGFALLSGGVAGTVQALTNYKWVWTGKLNVAEVEWNAVVMALNAEAAREHYLIAQRQADYVSTSQPWPRRWRSAHSQFRAST